MWTLYFVYFVAFLFVNPKVIPDYRKIPERADTLDRIQDVNSRRLRITKRDVYFDNISNETSVNEDTGTWSREVCEKTSRRRRLTPIVDERGERLLVLGPGSPASSICIWVLCRHTSLCPAWPQHGGRRQCEMWAAVSQVWLPHGQCWSENLQEINLASFWLRSLERMVIIKVDEIKTFFIHLQD